MFKVQYGELTKASYHYWYHYKALPKKVAFRNGKHLAFMATDASGQSYEQAEKVGEIHGFRWVRRRTLLHMGLDRPFRS